MEKTKKKKRWQKGKQEKDGREIKRRSGGKKERKNRLKEE